MGQLTADAIKNRKVEKKWQCCRVQKMRKQVES